MTGSAHDFRIAITAPGDADVLRRDPIDVAHPGPGEVLVRIEATGVNFIDVYHRTGFYPVPGYPTGIGVEGAGVVEAVGPPPAGGSTAVELEPGTRVAWVTATPGTYATRVIVAADRLVPLPDSIATRTAAAVMLKGMTARYLIRETYPLQSGETILVHAGAGGVGLLLCQWAAALGARVIATVGSPEKAALVRGHGAAETILYRTEDVTARVRELTAGAGVPVVYDSVGATTFEASLGSLAPRGLLVSFGQSSGPVPPVDPGRLSRAGSLYLTRPTLFHYIASRDALLANTRDLFAALADGTLTPPPPASRPLEEAAAAHRDLETRATTGATILIP